MSKDVVTATPTTSLNEVLELLSTHRVSGLPVVAGDGDVVGVVSQADILAATARRSELRVIADVLIDGTQADPSLRTRTAGEAMSSPALVIDENCPVTQAAAEMLENGIKRLPVVRARKLVGIVTRSDLLRAFTRSDEEIVHEIRDEVLARLLGLAPIDVAVFVENGVVALCGQVDTRSEAEAIDVLVSRVPGVVSVNASITWKIDDRGLGTTLPLKTP